MESWLQDLRYGARSLAKNPGFAAIAVATLAVGIGANTAIFTFVNAALLRPFPFREPARLMRVSLVTPPSDRRGPGPRDDLVWSYPKFQTLCSLQTVFEAISTYRGGQFNLTGIEEAERVRGEVVNAAYFPTLGVAAIAGRTFLPEEDRTPRTHMVALIGHGLWLRRFGGDPAIVGRSMTLDTRTYTIVGVAPPDFRGLTGLAEVWMPVMTLDPEEFNQPQSHSHDVVARVRRDVSMDQARAEVALLGPAIDRAHVREVDAAKLWGAKARPLDEVRVDPALRRSALVLLAAVGFVLLIACVNVANLLLARAGVRRREIAIRLAVGASRWRLVRQLLTESALLSLISGAAGVAVAYWGIELLTLLDPAGMAAPGRRLSGLTVVALGSVHLDAAALGFTLALALGTGLIFGLAPALGASRADVAESLKAGSEGSQVRRIRAFGGRSVLVVAEVALAVVLLVGSGLMIKSFARLVASPVGINPENLVTLRVNLPSGQYNPTQTAALFESLESRAAALPGVQGAGLSNCPPLAGGCNGTIIWFRDRPPVPRGSEPLVGVHWASPSYFSTMQIPLLRGRLFTVADRLGAPQVVLVSQEAARRFWPNEDPLGKAVAVGQGGFRDRALVVGIVGDVRYGAMGEPAIPDVYLPHLQSPRANLLLYVRTAGDPGPLVAALRKEVAQLDRNLPIWDVKPMRARFADASARARSSAALLAVFGAIAIVLAGIGIYGVMSYAVTQRTREIGVRIALGAERSHVLRLVLGRAALLAFIGITVGVGAALAASRVLETLLFEVTPADPPTYAAIATLLAALALAAGYLPARRATRVDPLVALRSE